MPYLYRNAQEKKCFCVPIIIAMALLLHCPKADKIWLMICWLAKTRSATPAAGPWCCAAPAAPPSLLPHTFSSSETLSVPPLAGGNLPLNSRSPDSGSITRALTSFSRSNISWSRVVSPHTALASPGRMMLANRPPKQARAPTELSEPLRETTLSEHVM